MTTSYNGWPASTDPAKIGIKPFAVAGRSFPGGVKGGSVHWVLKYVAAQMHVRVESLYTGIDKDDWGYSYRQNRNANNLSCHSSGTAIDVNATEHPNGQRNTFTYAQVLEIRKILKEVGGVVRWGGDFSDTKDEMHFEIKSNATAVAAVAKKLQNPTWWKRELKPGMTGDDVKYVQKRLKLKVDGNYGPVTADAVKRFRAKLHLPAGNSVTKGLAFYIGTAA